MPSSLSFSSFSSSPPSPFSALRNSSSNSLGKGSNKSRGSNKNNTADAPPTPSHHYFSRRPTGSFLPQLPDVSVVGIYSPFAVFWGCIFLTVPLAYIYIFLILFREVTFMVPSLAAFLSNQTTFPFLHYLLRLLQEHSSRSMELWCGVEGIFFILLQLKIAWLQSKDTLEASLSAAPLMDARDRRLLWKRMMESEYDTIIQFFTGWFFDSAIENISKYDIRDFVCWSMFEGRHQEHLTTNEVEQLEDFVREAELRISLQMYGELEVEEEEKKGEIISCRESSRKLFDQLPRPKKKFRFPEETQHDEPNFFSDLYESYRTRYESLVQNSDFHPVQGLRDMVKNADFHPVQDFRNLMADTAEHISQAEESAMATASQMYESIVPAGSQMDKQLSAMSRATYVQLTDAWNSVRNMRERLETAEILSSQRERLRQQLRGYRVSLNRMREMSSAIPSNQMASLMRRITECNEAIDAVERRAQNAFVQATGYARKNLSFLQRKAPVRYANYSSDPLLGIATYPLCFHLVVLGCTEIPLRIMMFRWGFERLSVGSVAYYFHPGRDSSSKQTPVVFVHGIGVGLIMYISLIDQLLSSGRPIFLPEIPYVSGFRPWQSPTGVLSPAVVGSTMTTMLASHGMMHATWLGHSYGTSWLSYMCKYASQAVAALVFLDPICFSLHIPRLTKEFVYRRADIGSISYMVRTDMIINWTIQRSFPWAWISLFVDEIPPSIPVAIFLSDQDQLVPSPKVEKYLESQGAPVSSETNVTTDHWKENFLSVTVFRGDGHGDWTERPSTSVPLVSEAAEILCKRVDAKQKVARR